MSLRLRQSQSRTQDNNYEDNNLGKDNQLTVIKRLGEGVFGTVDLVVNQFGQEFALKTYQLTNDLKPHTQAQREIEAGEKVQGHPSICHILGNWTIPDEGTKILMEYIHGTNLLEYMKRENFTPMGEAQAKRVLYQLASALDHCHSKGIAHRDVKLENLMLDQDNRLTLIDFGSSRCDGAKNCIEDVGSDKYNCPEILRCKPYNGMKADIWSVGVVLYAILCGRLPFSTSEIAAYRSREISKLEVKFRDRGKELSRESKDLIRKMLQLDPSKRPSMYKVLKSPWFRSSVLACSPRLMKRRTV